MSTARVRSHTRRRNGAVEHVRAHYRKFTPGQKRPKRRRKPRVFTFRHAGRTARKAFKARKRKGTAAVLGACALGELAACLTFEGLYLLFTTFLLLALGAGAAAHRATSRSS